MHGAIGYTWECHLHFFLKQTGALAGRGDAATHRRLVLASCPRADPATSGCRRQSGLAFLQGLHVCAKCADLAQQGADQLVIRQLAGSPVLPLVPVEDLRFGHGQTIRSASAPGLPDGNVRFPPVIVTRRATLAPVIEDPDRCYQAAQSKDARFDGWFFCAVTSTGIYCRPSCPARTPKRENMRFYATAAAAQQAGFRACLRCRPDATPGSPEWNVRADVVARAMRLIRDGVVDREGVEGLAGRLGYSTRQLNRLITAEVGTGPLALARAQRSQTARVLLETTDLPVAHVAFAAGFSSVRQCNETVRQIFADTPSGLRARAARTARAARRPGAGAPRPSGCGCPAASPSTPRRCSTSSACAPFPASRPSTARPTRAACACRTGTASSTLAARREPRRRGPAYVEGELGSRTCATCTTAVARCRQLLDLDADPVAIWEALRDDPLVGAAGRRDPGRRVPGAADGFELAVRAVIGQQVSVPGARTVAGRLVLAAGDPLPAPVGAVTHLFPTPAALVELAERDPAPSPCRPAGGAPWWRWPRRWTRATS